MHVRVSCNTLDMADMNMSEAERDQFLADVRVGILAIEHQGHGPLALPIWYQWEGGQVLVRLTPDKWRTCDFGKGMA